MRKASKSELIFKAILVGSTTGIACLVVAIFLTLLFNSFPAVKSFGVHMLTGKTWDPVSQEFGALPFLIGTLLTSFLALLISLPFSLSIAVYLGEYFKEGIFPTILSSMTEILAGIPSVIYGFWGLFMLVPLVRAIETKLHIDPYGVGILTASLVLSVMIVPYSASMAREVIRLVPLDIKEAAYALGATKVEVLQLIILPYARSGIMAGIFLSLGRALGETMAVTMVIGNSNFIPKSFFAPANTMASVIANEFTEATGVLHMTSLIELALLLFIVTTLINLIATRIISAMRVKAYG